MRCLIRFDNTISAPCPIRMHLFFFGSGVVVVVVFCFGIFGCFGFGAKILPLTRSWSFPISINVSSFSVLASNDNRFDSM